MARFTRKHGLYVLDCCILTYIVSSETLVHNSQVTGILSWNLVNNFVAIVFKNCCTVEASLIFHSLSFEATFLFQIC